MAEQSQLTMKPICPICHDVELTDQELAKGKETNNLTCWYCLVDTMIKAGLDQAMIPDPSLYGRAYETKDHGIKLAKEKMFRPIDTRAALSAINKNLNQQPNTQQGSQSAPQKPILQMPGPVNVPLSEQERKEFILKFGIDPMPKTKPYEIVVQGAIEDLYFKLGCPAPIDLAYEREIKRIMSNFLESVGKLLKYGPAFAATLIELENLTGSMFLGGR